MQIKTKRQHEEAHRVLEDRVQHLEGAIYAMNELITTILKKPAKKKKAPRSKSPKP